MRMFMMIFRYIADFLSGIWLWGMTWDWYHVPVNFLLLCFLLNFFVRLNIVQAVLISLLAHVYAFAVFSAGVVGILTHLLHYTYDPARAWYVPAPAHACFYLGLVYAVLQITFFMLIYRRYKFGLFNACLVAIISNCLSAGIAYWLLPVM